MAVLAGCLAILTFSTQAQAEDVGLGWAGQMGGLGWATAVDGLGNVYTTGYFEGTADFDPGAGIFNLTSVGKHDIFISKLDSQGEFLWAHSMGGPNTDRGASIAVDSLGNVLVTGEFWETVDFDPGSETFDLVSAGKADTFILKLDLAGEFVWAKAFHYIDFVKPADMAVDRSGNVYTIVPFAGTMDLDPDPGSDFFLTPVGGGK